MHISRAVDGQDWHHVGVEGRGCRSRLESQKFDVRMAPSEAFKAAIHGATGRDSLVVDVYHNEHSRILFVYRLKKMVVRGDFSHFTENGHARCCLEFPTPLFTETPQNVLLCLVLLLLFLLLPPRRGSILRVLPTGPICDTPEHSLSLRVSSQTLDMFVNLVLPIVRQDPFGPGAVTMRSGVLVFGQGLGHAVLGVFLHLAHIPHLLGGAVASILFFSLHRVFLLPCGSTPFCARLIRIPSRIPPRNVAL
mmetsp:Transcript_13782/g.40294  ORF Transcript_13782/g.40294 Transcript_13782/m.40294 type:complete len:250 (-) Transcript_13782:100-849(-)